MSFIVQQKLFELANQLDLHWVEYDLKAYDCNLFSQHGITPPKQLSSWVNKRQAQFLAGRIAAKNSLAEGYKNQPIGIGSHREPLWPKGIIGSISHDKAISIAASQKQQTGGIGVDIQTTFNNQEAEINKEIILSHSDKEYLQKRFVGFSRKQLLTLVFSSKESFFKAAFNQVGDYFNFKDISIKLIDLKAQKIYLVSDIKLTNEVTVNHNYVIDYQWINKNKIITGLNITV